MKTIAVVFLAGGLVGLMAVAAQTTNRPAIGTTEDIFETYGRLTGRTVLRASTLPLPAWNLSEVPADTSEAISYIESKLAKTQIELIRDGELFVRALRVGWTNSAMAAQFDRIKAPAARETTASGLLSRQSSNAAEILPPGVINFKNVELKDVLIIYAELRNRTILRPTLLPSPVIQFRTQTALTLEEAVYGLNIVLAMSGLAAVDDGDRFVLIVPLEDATRVGARSPKREQGASLIDPATVPVFPASPAGPAVLPRSAPHIGAALPPPSSPIVPQLGAAQLLAYYAELAKREVVDSGQFGSIAIDFRVQRPLTKTELLYAIERTFALNNLTLVLVGDNAVRLEPIPLKQVKER